VVLVHPAQRVDHLLLHLGVATQVRGDGGTRGQGHRGGCCDLVELLVGGLQVAVAAAQRPTREELGARVGDQVGEIRGSLLIQVVQLVLDGGGGVGLVAAGQAGDDVRQQGRRRPRPIACAVTTKDRKSTRLNSSHVSISY